MIYIPEDWIKNKSNEIEIRELISTCIGCFRSSKDLKEIENTENRLKELGEDRILVELKQGSFAL
nr:MAG TPA: TRCF domain [Caudoviricetes sp.]